MSLLDEPGDLATTPLAAVLLEALASRATGVLEVAHGGGTSRLWFREGRPVGAQVFTGFRPLGMMLLQAGRIDIDALSKSLVRMAETRRPQGELLVEMGVVSAADVAAALADQQAGYYGLIAGLDEGPFVFDATTPVPGWTRDSPLSALGTIADALERPQAASLVVSALQPVATAGVRLATDGAQGPGPAPWSGAERALVARLEGGAALEDFFLPSPVEPERARAILAALLLTGAAVPADRGLAAGACASAPPPAPRAESTGAAMEVGAGEGAGAGRGSPPAAPRRSDPAEARARRQRLLQRGLRNIGLGPFAVRGAGERPSAPPASGPDVSAASRSTPGIGPGPAPAERQLREALLAMAPRARASDLFARLAVPETAGREEVKRAFLAIARQFHPDRFASPAFADLQDTVRDFFAAMNEAYEVLGDDRRRAAYLVERRSAAAANVEAGRVDYLKAEACLRTRDWARARALLESAVRADPRAEYHASLAFTWLADPARRDPARARRLLAEAMKDPGCDRAHHVAGLLARDEGDDAAAERHFRAAVKANPRNADAARELRHLEARRGAQRG